LVIDTNGIGTAVVEELMQDLGDGNPPYAVVNNTDYDKYTLPNAIPMIYTIVAHSKGQSNNDMYNEFIRIINNHKIKIPYSANEAQLKFLKSKNTLTGEQLAEAIRPYAAIDLFVEETMNLEYKQSGNKTDVKQISRSIQKDRFSSIVYGLYWIYLKECENKEQNEETDWSQFTYVGDGKASIDKNVKWAG
jgi:stress response protein SCP2